MMKLLIATSIFLLHSCHAENVLFVAMTDNTSHRRSMYPLAEALAKNGHSVTFFSELGRADNAVGKNITNHVVLFETDPKQYENMEAFMNNMLWNRDSQTPLDIIFPWSMGTKMTGRLFNEKPEEYKKILRLQHWDLLVIDAIFTTTGVALASEVKAPYIIYDPSFVSSVESICTALPYPVVTIPPMFMSTTSFDHKIYTDRITAVVKTALDMLAFKIVDRFIYRPTVAQMVPDSSLLNFYQLSQGSFVDYPAVMDYPRPVSQHLFFTAGKCKSATLSDKDKDIRDFVEDPKSLGTIMIAFGHMVKWDGAPDAVKVSFAKAMNKLTDYRIIWQYKGDSPVPLGKHIKVMSWLPQTEVMNHAKTKLFISHGGLKSITEAVCGEVPAIVIPFFAEQIRNAFLFARSGSGETMNKKNLTEDNILRTVNKIISEDRYKSSVVKFKQFLTDKPISPSDNGIFWAEFVIRHKGLPDKWFKNVGIKMSWFTYFMVDVLLIIFLVVLIPIFCLVKMIKKIFKK